jgi:hypothetical protein
MECVAEYTVIRSPADSPDDHGHREGQYQGKGQIRAAQRAKESLNKMDGLNG